MLFILCFLQTELPALSLPPGVDLSSRGEGQEVFPLGVEGYLGDLHVAREWNGLRGEGKQETY